MKVVKPLIWLWRNTESFKKRMMIFFGFLAVKPGRDELFMGDRLNLSILFLRRNRRFFVDGTRLEFTLKTGNWTEIEYG